MADDDDTVSLTFDRPALNRATVLLALGVLLLGAAALFGVSLGTEERYRYERVALPESGQIPDPADDLNYAHVGCDSYYDDRTSEWDCFLAYNVLGGDVNATTNTSLYPGSDADYQRYLLNGSFYRPVLEPNDPEPTASYRLAYEHVPTTDALASLAVPVGDVSGPVANAVRSGSAVSYVEPPEEWPIVEHDGSYYAVRATDEVSGSDGLLWRQVRVGMTLFAWGGGALSLLGGLRTLSAARR